MSVQNRHWRLKAVKEVHLNIRCKMIGLIFKDLQEIKYVAVSVTDK
jgi:hypothetical protein